MIEEGGLGAQRLPRSAVPPARRRSQSRWDDAQCVDRSIRAAQGATRPHPACAARSGLVGLRKGCSARLNASGALRASVDGEARHDNRIDLSHLVCPVGCHAEADLEVVVV